MFGNKIKTFFLIFVLVYLFTFIGGVIGSKQGALLGLIVSAIISFFSYYYSDKMVINRYNGIEVTPNNESRVYNIVSRLVKTANMPMPKIYIIPEMQPNAFATGRNPKNAAIACTQGLLKIMNDEELSGVIAHELAHIKNYDTLISTIAATFAGAISNIARFLPYTSSRNREKNNSGLIILLSIFAPIAALIIQMSISRSREFMADKLGSQITGNPLYLRDALKKLEYYSQQIPMEANTTTSHMFIIPPFNLGNLFRTHPQTFERIRELEKMAESMGIK